MPPFPDLVLKVQPIGKNRSAEKEAEILQFLTQNRVDSDRDYRMAFPLFIAATQVHTASLQQIDKEFPTIKTRIPNAVVPACSHNSTLIHLHKKANGLPHAILMSWQGVALSELARVAFVITRNHIDISQRAFVRQLEAIKLYIKAASSASQRRILLTDRHAGNFVIWPEPRWVRTTLEHGAGEHCFTYPLSIIDFNVVPNHTSVSIIGQPVDPVIKIFASIADTARRRDRFIKASLQEARITTPKK